MSDQQEQVKRWRDRAAEMRSVADAMQDKSARSNLLTAAANWERMAANAEARHPAGQEPEPRVRRKTTIVTCRCGASYRRSMMPTAQRFRDTFECGVCRSPIEIWNSVLAPRFELISRPGKRSDAD